MIFAVRKRFDGEAKPLRNASADAPAAAPANGSAPDGNGAAH